MLVFVLLNRGANILIRVFEKSLDEKSIFFLDAGIDRRFVLVGNRGNDVRDITPVFLHLLMVASALAGVASDDHVRHHFIDPRVLLQLCVLQQLTEKS